MLVRILFCSLLLSCSQEPAFPEAPANCAAACARMKQLNHKGALGSPGPDQVYGTDDDVPCPVACVEMERISPFNLPCISNAVSKSAIDACAEGPE